MRKATWREVSWICPIRVKVLSLTGRVTFDFLLNLAPEVLLTEVCLFMEYDVSLDSEVSAAVELFEAVVWTIASNGSVLVSSHPRDI